MIRHPSSRSHRLNLPGFAPRDPLADALGRRLDDDWHWFRSPAPGGMEPIDAVLVGPGGTWALTSTDLRGRFTRRNGHWYRWNRSTESWVPWDATEVTAARVAARRLGLYLERAALPAGVVPTLVVRRETTLEAEPGEQLGVIVEPEIERLAGLVAGARAALTQQQVDRIVALLDPRQPLPRLAPSTPGG